MKVRRIMFFLLMLIFFGCENGENNSQIDKNNNSEGISEGFSIRFANPCQSGTISAENIGTVAFLNITIISPSGETLFTKTLTQNDISANTSVSGLPETTGATVILSGFSVKDNNTPSWKGTVTGVTFKKGQTTNISATLYPQHGSKTVCLPGQLSVPRFAHTTTLLPDGRILVAGGFATCTGTECNATKSVEIIDTETGEVQKLADMMTARAFQTAIPLPNGTVLFLGGVKSLEMNGAQQITDFPNIPFTLSSPSEGIELYNPGYPKYNMLTNKIGSQVPNTSDLIKTGGNFFAYQKIIPIKTGDKSWKVYLVGGVDSSNNALAKIYSLTIDTTRGTTVSDMTEETISDMPATILPILAETKAGNLFVLGGMKNKKEVAGTVESSSFSVWSNDKIPNIYFSSIIDVDNSIYTFGGMLQNADNSLIETPKIYKITPDSQEITSGKMMVSSSIFQDVVFNDFNETFIVIGGTLSILNDWKDWRKADTTQPRGTAHNFVRTFDESFNAKPNINTFYMNFDRLLSSSIITKEGYLFIIGGTTGFNASGKPLGFIEVKKVN